MPDTKLVKREPETQGAQDLAAYIRGSWDQIKQALPAHLDPGRFVRVILTEVRKSDIQKAAGVSKTSLSECSPASILGGVLAAATLGLEVGVNGEAYLVPYVVKGRPEAQMIIGYQGLAKLAWQHPAVRSIQAHAVYPGDDYQVTLGTEPSITHRPNPHGDNDQPIAYYAIIGLVSGGQIVESLTPDDVRRLRGGRVGPSGQIADPMRWMERKTALKQALKLAPKSASLQRALPIDDAQPLFTLDMPAVSGSTASPPALQATIVDTETGEVLGTDDALLPDGASA